MPGEDKVADHVLLRAPRPRFTVDKERGESVLPPFTQPVVPVELPAGIDPFSTTPSNAVQLKPI